MRTLSIIAVICIAPNVPAETIDRIAVSAGNQVVTESSILLDLRVSAFLDRRPVDLTQEAKRKSANRLVDQMLILREAQDSRIVLPEPKDADMLLAAVKKGFGSEADFQAELSRYSISEDDVRAQLLSGLIELTFSDQRFQTAAVSEEDARAYYNTLKLTTSFEENREQINEVIAQQRASEALDDWLVSARETARVTFREQVFR
jgi:hypothetical protein